MSILITEPITISASKPVKAKHILKKSFIPLQSFFPNDYRGTLSS
nr:MAG TPA: hypothetical protein [Caudoviricetes sp.]